ncbi:MAG: EamA family transporter RarD [Oscillospiraceae bacterium]|nr:EamA family transporter RarD [Oscillospiraceae bacterium]
MSRKNKGLTFGLLCYLLWGILPAFWNLMAGISPFVILCARVVFALIFMLGVLAVMGKLGLFWATLRDWRKMRFLVPAAFLIAFNWGLFIWAVNTGQIIYTSLGYYMNPLMAFVLGVVLFKEKYTVLQLVAVGLALIGLLISIFAYGRVPVISISLALSFAMYGVLKKKAGADPNASIAIESLLVTPFALIFAFGFMMDGVRALGTGEILLLIGGGAATAIPLVLYARAINDIPFTTVGFLQYIAPTLSIIYGLIIGIRPTESQIVTIIFIGLALIVFSIALVRIAKAEPAPGGTPEPPPPPPRQAG